MLLAQIQYGERPGEIEGGLEILVQDRTHARRIARALIAVYGGWATPFVYIPLGRPPRGYHLEIA